MKEMWKLRKLMFIGLTRTSFALLLKKGQIIVILALTKMYAHTHALASRAQYICVLSSYDFSVGSKDCFFPFYSFIYTEKPKAWNRIIYNISCYSLFSWNFLGVMQESLPIEVVLRQKRPVLRECKICGGFAKYSYYGAIACHSCKVFFRRNVTEDLVSSPFDKEFSVDFFQI